MPSRRSLALLLLCGACGCGRVQGEPEAALPAFVLTAAEVQLARDLAESQIHPPAHPMSPQERVYFIKVDLLPDTQAGSANRRVMVHHYRYQGDETIFTLVDLHSAEVLKVETALHYPTALADEEKERAAALARHDERVRPFVQGGAEFEFRPIQLTAKDEPMAGHRVVHVLLRGPDGYFSRPRVLVDLTTETVHLAE
jgi:hypothetical protein